MDDIVKYSIVNICYTLKTKHSSIEKHDKFNWLQFQLKTVYAEDTCPYTAKTGED